MKAIVLAAGYATRLRPLTDDFPKPLLPVGGRPMLDRIADRIDEVEEVDALHVVTNDRHAASFERWAVARGGVDVVNDGTHTNDDRLGAIGDIALTIDRAGLQGQDLLVIAGDNLFDYSLASYVDFWRLKGEASAVAVRRIADRELIKQYGVVSVDDDDRITSFVEKPNDPQSDLAATATYIYHRDHAARITDYLGEGSSPDQPGRLLAWLAEREPVYGYAFEGLWMDVGDHDQLLDADNLLREREGLPVRTEYSPQI